MLGISVSQGMAAKQVDSSPSLQLNAGGLSKWSPNLILNGEDLGSSRAVDHTTTKSERHYQHTRGDPREIMIYHSPRGEP